MKIKVIKMKLKFHTEAEDDEALNRGDIQTLKRDSLLKKAWITNLSCSPLLACSITDSILPWMTWCVAPVVSMVYDKT